MTLNGKQLKLQMLCNSITRHLGLKHIRVLLVNENSENYYGEFVYEGVQYIKVYHSTIGKQNDYDTLVETLKHELSHYANYTVNGSVEHDDEFNHLFSILQETY